MDNDLKFEDLPEAQYEEVPDLGTDLTPEEKQKAEWLAQPAPYGRFKSGKPKKTPPKGAPKVKSTTAKKSRSNQPDYEEGISGLLQMASFGLAMAGSNNPILLADSIAVNKHGPGVAAALAGLANERPEVAAVLDRILAVGPYSAVLAAIVPLIMQIIANHGIKLPGVQGPEELIAEVEMEYKQAAHAA